MRRSLLVCLLALFLIGCNSAEQVAPTGQKKELPLTPAEHANGEALYVQNCSPCHDTSRDGAPRLGFKTAWKRRTRQGQEVLVQSAIQGIGLMPPRGDNPDLTNEQIAEIIGYMVYRAELDIPAGH